MNYYPFHIGDYHAHTAHLDELEDIAYRRCLDAYYLREGPLPQDPAEVARLVRMRTHAPVVAAVLAEFFVQAPTGWLHARCEDELARMVDKRAKAQASAAASVAARKARKDGAEPTPTDRSADVQRSLNGGLAPNTNTNTNTKKEDRRAARFDAAASLVSHGVEETLAREFATYRRKAPLTASAVALLAREAGKAGWTLADALREAMARGWTGFKAEWVAPRQPGRVAADVAHVTTPTPPNADAALKKLREDDKRAVPPPPDIRARLDQLRKPPGSTEAHDAL